MIINNLIFTMATSKTIDEVKEYHRRVYDKLPNEPIVKYIKETGGFEKVVFEVIDKTDDLASYNLDNIYTNNNIKINNIKKHNIKKKYKCDVCNYTVIHFSNYNRHLISKKHIRKKELRNKIDIIYECLR